MLLMVAVVVLQPGRGGSLLLNGLAAGVTSRRAVASYVMGGCGLAFVALLARTHLTLERGAGGVARLVDQGVAHRTVVALADVRAVHLVRGRAGRGVLVGADGSCVASVAMFTRFWTRDDVVDALAAGDIEVVPVHRLTTAVEVEAAYPGSTAWLERHPAALRTIIVLAFVGAVLLLAWYLQF